MVIVDGVASLEWFMKLWNIRDVLFIYGDGVPFLVASWVRFFLFIIEVVIVGVEQSTYQSSRFRVVFLLYVNLYSKIRDLLRFN